MARIGRIQLLDGYRSGGAFKLTDTPNIGSEIDLSDGWRATLAEDTSYVVVQSEAEGNSDEILKESYNAATRALDIFSITTDFEECCIEAYNENILWWEEDGHNFIRLTGIAGMTSSGSATVRKDGETPEPTIPDWHESFRYYRLSQTTQDLFDAYRNQFLALEHILTDIYSQEGDEERDHWLVRTLHEAHRRHDLSNFAFDPDDPAESILQDQWYGVRCKMFHSKAGGERLEPRNSDDIKLVEERLENLTRIYSHLVTNEFGRPLASGGLTSYGFKKGMGWIRQEDTEFVISSDSSEWGNNTDWSDIPSIADCFPSEYAGDRSNQKTQLTVGKIDVDEITQHPVRRFGLVKRDEGDENSLLIRTDLMDELDIVGYDVLTIQQGVTHITGSRSAID